MESLTSYIKIINSRKWDRNKNIDENDIVKGFEKYSSKFDLEMLNETKLDYYM